MCVCCSEAPPELFTPPPFVHTESVPPPPFVHTEFVQVLMSIYGLIFVESPYFNEPGYEASMGTPEGDKKNANYNSLQRAFSVKLAMKASLESPPVAFEDVVKLHFWLRKEDIAERIEGWAAEMPDGGATGESRATKSEMLKNIAAFKKLIKQP